MLFTEAELDLLSSLRLLPRFRVRQQVLSDYRSKDQGEGLEFADYRQYISGDDIRRLDWHQYQKHGQLVVRQYEQHESVSFDLIVDVSDSVLCGSSKRVEAVKKISAAYGFVLLRHGCKVTVWPVADNVIPRTFFGPSHWLECISHIESMPTGGRLDMTQVLSGGNGYRKRADNVIFVSDMICSKGYEHLESMLSQLRQNQVYIHIYDESDANPGYSGDLTLVDAELQSEQPLVVDRKKIEAYQRAYKSYYGRLRMHAERLGYYYNDISSEWDLTRQIQTLAPDALICI
jgi:uncharacterized protein (DUF58 family)